MTDDIEKSASQMGIGEIVATLEEEIALGIIGPRERLVEEELAQRFNVKRHVARQALTDLETMGLVGRQPNRGAAVRDYGAAEIEQLYDARQLVECHAAGLVPLPAPRGLVEALESIHKRHSAAVARGDLRRVFRENLLFHKTFFAACGNAPLVEVIETLAMKTHAIRSFSIGDPNLLKVVCREHAEMIKLLQGKKHEPLITLVGKHLQPAKNAYLRLARHKAPTA
jgi:DNA-binding GntR family transcriptional regulator